MHQKIKVVELKNLRTYSVGNSFLKKKREKMEKSQGHIIL